MKQYNSIPFFSVILVIIIPIMILPLEDFKVTLQPQWINLEQTDDSVQEFGGKWMLAGSIIFKKKIKDPIYLKHIIMKWTGNTIDGLMASLYKKDPDKDFVPIEDNLICDGIWNKTKQMLVLNFDEKITLGPITVFYLVLTVPEFLEPLLRSGSFSIDKQCLPEPFREYAHDHTLSFVFKSIIPESGHDTA